MNFCYARQPQALARFGVRRRPLLACLISTQRSRPWKTRASASAKCPAKRQAIDNDIEGWGGAMVLNTAKQAQLSIRRLISPIGLAVAGGMASMPSGCSAVLSWIDAAGRTSVNLASASSPSSRWGWACG
jgi:hypothetical protein